MRRIVAVLVVSWGMASTALPETGVVPMTLAQRDALGIVVATARAHALVPQPRLPGRVTLPNSRIRVVTARSPGVLVSPAVAVGDRVEVGQELARIESPAFVALQREYLEVLSQLELARSTARRETQLADEGIIAGRRAEESAAVLREARARLEERRQALVLAGMRDEAVAELGRTRRLEPAVAVRAPLAGVVLEQYARAGERLEAGGSLYRIGALGSLLVEVHTPLDLARSLSVGTRFVLPDQHTSGRVLTVGSEIHAIDQGVLVRGELDDGPQPLRPGQFVAVQFETARANGTAFTLPSTAVVHLDEQAWIFEALEQGFHPVPVEIIGGAGTDRVVVGPIGDRAAVAVAGTAALKARWLAEGGPH